jgi:hypothetical protein
MSKRNNFIIDRDTYKISDKNYYKEEQPKSQIILASTNRKSNNYILRQLKKENGLSTTWSTYTITRDGLIYEHYNPVYYTDFVGDQNIDIKSVSVLLENMGPLLYNDDNESYYNDLNEKFEGTEDDVFKKEWRGYKYYEPYTKDQYNATVFLSRLLCLELNISDDSYGHNAFEDGSKYFNGVISRSNLDMNSSDLNPSFDFKKFLRDLKK